MPELVEIRDAHYAFETRRALRGVTLRIPEAQVFALLGPNGAGKTTLVRTISGRIVPTSGSVTVGGLAPARSRRARSLTGLVPQQIALYPALTSLENLVAFGRLMGVRGRDAHRRAGEVLDAIGLADRADERAGRLSGGMQRRLNIGAAVMHRPRLLVLDEPTVGVDLHAKEAIHQLLLDLRAGGMAILMTTHDMDQAAAIADRVAIMVDGAIRAEGSPQGLVAERFGGRKQIVVDLPLAPPAPARDHLLALGLRQMGDADTWAGRFDGGYEGVARLEQLLTREGIPPREIAIREPTLMSVFLETVAGGGGADGAQAAP